MIEVYQKRIGLGKIAYDQENRIKPRKINAVVVQINLYPGNRLGISADIWNMHRTDTVACGQVIEEIATYFPGNAKLKRMVDVWRKFQLKKVSGKLLAEVMSW